MTQSDPNEDPQSRPDKAATVGAPAATPIEETVRSWDPAAELDEAIPAATAVLLKDSDDGIVVLMLRRNTKLAFVGGAWVFPGGRVDPGDTADGDPFSIESALVAARRETMEEAGLDLAGCELECLSHWMPPAGTPRRFSTWFLVGAGPVGDITVDGGEIEDHMWIRPSTALERRDAGEVQLAPPTFVTLCSLSRFDTVAEALATLSREPVEHFETRVVDVDGDLCAVWHGDAFYEGATAAADRPDSVADTSTASNSDPNAVGRHRLRMSPDRWEYVRELR